MNIGTAKPTRMEQAQIKHHMIDVVDPTARFSAGEYAGQARAVIQRLMDRGITPLVVGGSGLYIRALLDGFFEGQGSDSDIRERLRERAGKEGAPALHHVLQKADPELADRIHPNDVQRIVRGLEVYYAAGIPLSVMQRVSSMPAPFKPVMVGLMRDRATLYHRINERADRMIDQGLIGEVQDLMQRGYGSDLHALRTVGYREVLSYLQGVHGLPQTVREIQTNTRRYAKRQLTWFRHEQRIWWLDAGEDRGSLVERIVQRFMERRKNRTKREDFC
jgi:tRNA dimethylallyltransferase